MKTKKCECNKESLFTMDYTKGRHWGTLTGSDPDTFIINKYCKGCRAQEGCIDIAYEERDLATLEFTSPELTEWFNAKDE